MTSDLTCLGITSGPIYFVAETREIARADFNTKAASSTILMDATRPTVCRANGLAIFSQSSETADILLQEDCIFLRRDVLKTFLRTSGP